MKRLPKGFTIAVMHVGIENQDLSIARVCTRVGEANIIVFEDKIRAQYARSAPFIRSAVHKADLGHGLRQRQS
ncbi:hypothetical protein [Altericroceibacterium spongiae]|uniref:hypothetical protein n=1 Tax=Altericroceibacterium spongiae TaxID=2320269 RepID=UPI0011C4920E|nr:hypothetical protein [Altericroceibacterium spongiae]